jgi:hypothetical protein
MTATAFLGPTVSDEFVLFAFLGIFAVLFFFIGWAYNRKGFALYIVLWACIVLCVVFAVHSTLPSSAPRRHVIGMISSITDIKKGRSHSYIVNFKADSGLAYSFDAAATPLFFAEGRDKVEITYLDEHRFRRCPRAIKFRALTGPRAGDVTAVSADWFGPWLGVLISAITGLAAIIANRNKRHEKHD